MDSIFYVYMFLDPLKGGEPFYVGKGKGRRAWLHTGNTHTTNRIKEIRRMGAKHEIKVVREGLSEVTALKVEAHLIRRIGRADLGTGPLTNWHVSGADQRVVNKTHHAKACSAAQLARFSEPSAREKVGAGVSRWVEAHPVEFAEAASRRADTLRLEEVRKKTSVTMQGLYLKHPEVLGAQVASRSRTQQDRNYYAQISRSLGGKPIEVITDSEVTRFDSQHQVAKFLGCYPARVNAALHKRDGQFSATVRLRFVPEEVSPVQESGSIGGIS